MTINFPHIRGILSTGLAATLAAALTLTLTSPAGADDGSSTDTVTASQTLTALQNTPGVLAASDTVTTHSDADSAAVSSVAGTTVDVPRDAADGVSMTTADGSSLTVTPPQSGSAPAAAVAPGVVAYPGTDGSSTAVQTTENGGVRMLTVITDATAPQDYTYDVAVPGGGSVVINNDGSASVLDTNGNVVSNVQTPWATDANGVSVPTRYTTDGNSLTQHIDFTSGNYAFPLKADPWFWSYLGCITGVGVPIGAAIVALPYLTYASVYVFAANKAATYRPGGPPIVSTILKAYGRAIYNSCRNFLLS